MEGELLKPSVSCIYGTFSSSSHLCFSCCITAKGFTQPILFWNALPLSHTVVVSAVTAQQKHLRVRLFPSFPLLPFWNFVIRFYVHQKYINIKRIFFFLEGSAEKKRKKETKPPRPPPECPSGRVSKPGRVIGGRGSRWLADHRESLTTRGGFPWVAPAQTLFRPSLTCTFAVNPKEGGGRRWGRGMRPGEKLPSSFRRSVGARRGARAFPAGKGTVRGRWGSGGGPGGRKGAR